MVLLDITPEAVAVIRRLVWSKAFSIEDTIVDGDYSWVSLTAEQREKIQNKRNWIQRLTQLGWRLECQVCQTCRGTGLQALHTRVGSYFTRQVICRDCGGIGTHHIPNAKERPPDA